MIVSFRCNYLAHAAQVLATGGDANLGGDDWDAAIADYIAAKALKPRGVDTSSPTARSRLRTLARAAKEQLSDNRAVTVRLPRDADVVLSQQLLEELSKKLFKRCRLPVDQACWQAGVDLGELLEDHALQVCSLAHLSPRFWHGCGSSRERGRCAIVWKASGPRTHRVRSRERRQAV